MLVEVRLSPQINTWIYGFFQHDFIQMMRYGGFRPIVFLPHGLWVAFFAYDRRSGRGRALARGAAGAARALPARPRSTSGSCSCSARAWRCSSTRRLRAAGRLAGDASRSASRRRWRCSPIALSAARAAPTSCRSTGCSRRRRRSAPSAPLAPLPLRQRGAPARPRPREAAVRVGRLGPQPRLRFETGKPAEHHRRALDHRHRRATAGAATSSSSACWPCRSSCSPAGSARAPPAAVSPYVGPLALILGVNMIDMLPNAPLIPFTWLHRRGDARLRRGAQGGALRPRRPHAGRRRDGRPARPRTIL